MAANTIADPVQSLLDRFIGSSQETGSTEELGVHNVIDQVLNNSGTSNTATTGSQASTGQTSQTGSQSSTGQTTQQQNTNNVSSVNADVSALQKVFSQQQAGITPEMLASIFSEGQKQVPGLTATYANAVGARPGDNTPLATGLRDLSTNLVSQAAQLNTKMLADSGNTAAQIANLTKTITDTGSQTQAGTQAQNVANSQLTNQNTQNTNQQNVNQVTGQTQTQNTNQTQNSTKNLDQTTRTSINTKAAGQVAALAGLAQLLKASGGNLGSILQGGQLNQILAAIGGNGTDISQLWSSLGIDSNNPLAGTGGSDFGIDPNIADQIPAYDDSAFWDNFDWGFADGGRVPTPADMVRKASGRSLIRKYADGGLISKAPTLEFSKNPKPSSPGSIAGAVDGGGSSGGLDLMSLLAPLLAGAAAQNGISGGGSDDGGTTADSGVGSADNAGNATPGGGFGGLGGSPIGNMAGPMAGAVLGVPGFMATAAINAILGQVAQTDHAQEQTAFNQEAIQFANEHEGTTADSTGVQGAEGFEGASASSVGDGSSDGGDSGEGSGEGGIGGASGDSAGYRDGGKLPRTPGDSKGIKDKITANLSGGEYIMSKDVVDQLGAGFFDNLQMLFHTPASVQAGQEEEQD